MAILLGSREKEVEGSIYKVLFPFPQNPASIAIDRVDKRNFTIERSLAAKHG
ncbi:hypothetical protein [Nostoc sp. FACHB-133]|uniref:hypothetical protein n=1 Tax=Nostoc sp. FACHB-133 TaxID=2692835 RepID=UPI001686604D|nr:hypothetical protein [Nostoc sp. FACHB-133]MBD2524592.1 hypothetical protein [Nostoc sp. FACHB-133]